MFSRLFKNNPYSKLFASLRRYTHSKSLLVIMLIFSLISKIIRLLEPFIFGKMINIIQAQWASGRWELKWWIVAFICINPVFWLFHGFSRIRENTIKFHVGKNFILDYFHKTTSLPLQRHNDHHSGETIDKINKWLYAIKNFTWQQFMYLGTIMFLVWSLFSLFLIWRKAWIVVVCVMVLIFTLVYVFDTSIVKLIKQKNKKDHVVSSGLFDFLSNIKTVITLRFEERAHQSLDTKINNVRPITYKSITISEWKRFTTDILKWLMIGGIFGWYVYEQFSLWSTIMIGTITMMWQYLEKINSGFGNFTWQWGEIVTRAADLEAVKNIDIAYHTTELQHYETIENRKNITINNLHFSYEDQSHQAHTLTNISLTIHPWETIALVWESGSGKSTLLSLLRWLYDVDSVLLDVDSNTYRTLHPLAHSTSLIPQEPEILETTIRENLTMWLAIDGDILEEVMKVACVDKVIHKLPQWLDTNMKEKWVNLSGWQKQRLALARGLLMSSESDIILLDEPTSSVDGINEKIIHERLFDYYADKTIISAIHKLHLVPLFDKVIVMDKWIIKEVGSPSELLNQPWSHFATLRSKMQTTSQ